MNSKTSLNQFYLGHSKNHRLKQNVYEYLIYYININMAYILKSIRFAVKFYTTIEGSYIERISKTNKFTRLYLYHFNKQQA